MKQAWRWLIGLLTVCMAVCTIWAAGLLVCPKCGYEVDATATICAHCGAALPPPKADAAASSALEAPHADTVSTQAMEAARTDWRAALDCQVLRPELAWAYCENALALSRLVRRDTIAMGSGSALAEGLERNRAAVKQSTRPCAICNGTGRRTVQFQGLSGDKNTQVAEGLTCTACGGSGVMRVNRTADELRVLLAQARRDFDAREQAQGRVACGRVWLPQGLADQLSVREQALIRTAAPTPCSSCQGTGVEDCGRCKGSGHVKCSNEGCDNGWIVRKELNTLTTKGNLNRREQCPLCQGTGWNPCPDCHGQGTVACKSCHGSGRSPVCQDCGGQGWSGCARCHGTGKLSDGGVCPDCHGLADRLCPKCHGEGCTGR